MSIQSAEKEIDNANFNVDTIAGNDKNGKTTSGVVMRKKSVQDIERVTTTADNNNAPAMPVSGVESSVDAEKCSGKSQPNVDHSVQMLPEDLQELVRQIQETQLILKRKLKSSSSCNSTSSANR